MLPKERDILCIKMEEFTFLKIHKTLSPLFLFIYDKSQIVIVTAISHKNFFIVNKSL